MKRKKVHDSYQMGDLIYTRRHGLRIVLSNVTVDVDDDNDSDTLKTILHTVGLGRYKVATIDVLKIIDPDEHKHVGDLLKISDTVTIRRLKPGHRVRHLNLKTFTKLRVGVEVPVLSVGKRKLTKLLDADAGYR